jgi:hypothetical protein
MADPKKIREATAPAESKEEEEGKEGKINRQHPSGDGHMLHMPVSEQLRQSTITPFNSSLRR